jgi:hypothetical protein
MDGCACRYAVRPSLSIALPEHRQRLLGHTLCLVDVGLDGSLEGLGVGADNLSDLVATLEQQEGGHGADAELLCDIGDLVNVELEEAGVGVCAGHPVAGVSGGDGEKLGGNTYLTTWGAMTLQGPHQVAKQSRTMSESLTFSASSKAALL